MENQNKLTELVANQVEKNHGFVFLATLKESGYANQSSLNYLKKRDLKRSVGESIYRRYTMKTTRTFFKSDLRKAYTPMKQHFTCMVCPTLHPLSTR